MANNVYGLNEQKLEQILSEVAKAINSQYARQDTVNEISNKLTSLTNKIDNIQIEFIPVGSVIDVLGKKAPTGFVKCDGTIYSISYHKELADYIKDQYGSYKFFGGNGTTTFAVPKLESEYENIIKCIKS